MNPTLLILNGPLGIGKTTLASLYAENHSLVLNLDIDKIWFMLGQWKENKDASTALSKDIAFAMARVNLQAGHGVVIPQIIQSIELADRFRGLASECNATYAEILLYVNKSEAIERYKKRNIEAGYLTGFKPGSIIDSEGREGKLSDMYDKMMVAVESREDVCRIESIYGDAASTYESMLRALGT